jgi:hypothetical protein
MLDGRISYPKLFKPEGIKGDAASKPRYGCQILLPKSDKKAKAKLDAEIERLSKTHFKGKTPKSKDLFFKDGDGEDGDDHSAGCWMISANRAESQGRPQVVDQKKQPISQEDGKIFAGYDCRFVISVFVPKNWGKICASLEVVQLLGVNDIIGAGPVDVDDVLPDLDYDDEDEDEDGL